MEVVHPRCCGTDVHQASLAVCLVVCASEKHRLCCGTTTAELLRLADWLHGHQVTHVALEAAGVYWKPVGRILEGQFELLLASPASMTKGSYFKALYHPLAARRGKSEPIVAVAHALLSTGYILLWTGRTFSDLGEHYLIAWIESACLSG